jgi:hypothetical protein
MKWAMVLERHGWMLFAGASFEELKHDGPTLTEVQYEAAIRMYSIEVSSCADPMWIRGTGVLKCPACVIFERTWACS